MRAQPPILNGATGQTGAVAELGGDKDAITEQPT